MFCEKNKKYTFQVPIIITFSFALWKCSLHTCYFFKGNKLIYALEAQGCVLISTLQIETLTIVYIVGNSFWF